MAGVKGRSGGARPGSGRKKKPPVLLADDLIGSEPPPVTESAILAPPGGDPDSIRFLRAAVNHPGLDVKLRIDAAKALAPYEAQRKGEGGKKDEQGAAAKRAAGGKFAPAAPPKLVVSNK